ncbi:hypothetical protein PDIG_76250 [Penicillium digitatum PHI26]|uniref:Uncharacterized protein n=2 Tax=Penicillium digitatum TaxID=36651 RepID=K9FFF1_PEND2|nr:hypothetical protein PDIP_46720 [Penicillium digitatum Pd1]EKV06852.1 hypothetical protein PDIG_76250 [Penicillium digitatum PHI26]EKV13888.1 hypothetical protein PDIP_46720 [Penicillium digitatum Pd1]
MVETESEKPPQGDNIHANDEEDGEYITGFKLWAILISGTLVQFVMMLDQSIIATVYIQTPMVVRVWWHTKHLSGRSVYHG